jgi:hypothetical protein
VPVMGTSVVSYDAVIGCSVVVSNERCDSSCEIPCHALAVTTPGVERDSERISHCMLSFHSFLYNVTVDTQVPPAA